MQGFAALLDWMEPGREDRTVVYKLKTDGKKYAELQQGAPELESVDSVCRSFDVLGYMDRKGLVPMEYVDELYAGALGRVYEDYLAPHIELKRKERGGGHFWELEQLYRRTQNVSEKHPIKTGTEDWPRERRGISQWRPS